MRRVLIAIGWCLVGVIWWLSLTPQPPRVDFENSDKVGHFLAYALGLIAMGIAIEFIQRWTRYRSFEVYDMLAGALGVLLGWACAFALPWTRR